MPEGSCFFEQAAGVGHGVREQTQHVGERRVEADEARQDGAVETWR